jgi:lysophospholipase L1-like esterase
MLTNRRKALLAAILSTGIAGTWGAGMTPANATTAHHYRNYVALGDSYSADVLTSLPIDTDGVPIGCAQSASDYPHQVAEALGVTNFQDATCGGATTEHMIDPQSVPLGGVNQPQFDRLSPATDLVTLGIGGNDIGLVGIVESCMTLLPVDLPGQGCKAKYTAGGTDQVDALTAKAAGKVRMVIAGIKARAPHARIVVVNYLDAVPLNGTACWGPVAPVPKVDMTWFAKKFIGMNSMLANVAKQMHVDLADTFSPTVGHDVCKAPTVRYVEGLIPLSLQNKWLAAFPFHPNQGGANAQTQAVVNTINQ